MYRNIVFAYDGSDECRDALADATGLAVVCGARCHLLAVTQPLTPLALAVGPGLSEEMMEEERSRLQSVLDEGIARLRQAGLAVDGTLRFADSPAHAIGTFAAEVSADLVVVGHVRRSLVERWWHGSVGHSLLDYVPCSLLVSMPRATVDATTREGGPAR